MKVRVKTEDGEIYISKSDLIKELRELADYLVTGNDEARKTADAYRRLARDLEVIK